MKYFNRKKNRLPGFDYSSCNRYFITSIVKYRKPYFGNVFDSKMVLSDYGHIVDQQWDWLLKTYPYLKSHGFIVMPDHIHGILEITDEPSYQGKIKSLSELMGAYKTTTSKHIHLAGVPDFEWHRSFHDHIVRNESAFICMKNYIRLNPKRWMEKKYHQPRVVVTGRDLSLLR
ncbi:MAG: transposase [Bacteroidetes bacterium]|nr:transposase [Bacteroidota bacterium]